MDSNEYTSDIPDEEPSEPKISVTGFAEPPLIVPMSEALGARKAAIRVRLDDLEHKGAEAFCDRTMQKLANSLGNLSEAVIDIDPGIESVGLSEIAEALLGLEIEDGAGRSNVGFWEKVKGRESPLTLLLDELEQMAKSMPSFADPQEQQWKELATAYKRVHALSFELGDSVSAGRVRISKTNADLKPAHDKTLETLPEDRGAETENALLALRAARDNVERRIHALRGAHTRATDVLKVVRLLAAARQEMRRHRKNLDARALPKWEEAVADTIRSASADGQSATGTDLGALRSANEGLAEILKQAAGAGQDLSAAYREARKAISNPSTPSTPSD